MLAEMSAELRGMPVGSIKQNVALAHAALELRLQTPAEQEILRGIQVDATKAIANALARGESAFHIDEATGVGKTAIGLQFAEAVMPLLSKDGHGRAIFVAPTLDILTQTVAAAAAFAPNLKVSAYSSLGEDLDGDVIVTTYHSLGNVVTGLLGKAQDVRLLIADEFHKGQGEQRSAAYPAMPNAIMLGLSATPDDRTIQAMIDAGKVPADARWVQMFRNKVHEVDLSEAVGEILAPLSVRIIETDLDATQVTVESNGSYNPAQIDAFARMGGRSLMALAFFKGSQIMAENGIRLPQEQLDEIEAAYREVRERKNILVFGQTIDHANEIVAMLQAEGITAAAYHSEVKPAERTRLRETGFDSYRVLVGVRNALGEGVDLPEADTAIFLDVTRDPLGLEQKLGRILRPLPGKTALAIQLSDKFHLGRQPVLIPHLFNRDAIELNRRRALGVVRRRRPEGGEVIERPRITFTGVDMQAYFHRAEFERIVQTGITQAGSIEELDRNLSIILEGVTSNIGVVSTMEYYQAIADVLPSRLPEKINQMAFAAAMAGDAQGARALLFLNLKTLLTIVHKMGAGREEDDTIQEAVLAFMERYRELNPKLPVAQAVYQLIEESVAAHIADREFMDVVGWVRNGWYGRIHDLAEGYLQGLTDPLLINPKDFTRVVHQEIPEYSGADSSLVTYIETKHAVDMWEEEILSGRVATRVDANVIREVMEDALTERERFVVDLRFGFNEYGRVYTLEEVGRELKVTRERIREIEARALRKLRHPQHERRLRDAR